MLIILTVVLFNRKFNILVITSRSSRTSDQNFTPRYIVHMRLHPVHALVGLMWFAISIEVGEGVQLFLSG